MNETTQSLAERNNTQSPEVGTSTATEVKVSMVPFEEGPETELTGSTPGGKDSRVLFSGTRLVRSISPRQPEEKGMPRPLAAFDFPAASYLNSPTQEAAAVSVDTPISLMPFFGRRGRSKTGGLLAGVVGRIPTPRGDRHIPSPIVSN
jgi:hypothetical protein